MEDVTTQLETCPNCKRRIEHNQHIENCAICGKLLCAKCIESSKFCPDCALCIPPEFQQKFRWLNPFVPLLLVFVACVVAGRAFYAFGGWKPTDFNGTLVGLGVTALSWLGGFILLLIAVRLPHFGTRRYYHWIAKSTNRAKVDAALDDLESGRYIPQSRLFRAKLALSSAYQKWGNKVVILCGIIGAVFTFIYSEMRWIVPIPEMPQFAGAMWAVGYISSIVMVGITAGFYMNREATSKKMHKILEFLSWGYLILLLLSGSVYLFHTAVILIDFPGVNSAILFPILTNAYTLLLFLQTTFIVLLGWQMLRITPVWHVPRAYERKDVKGSFRWFIRMCVKIVLGGIALVLLVFNILMLVGIDVPAVAWLLPVTSYYLLPMFYVPIFVLLLKMLPWKPRRYRQVYWRAVKVFAVVVCISLVPILSIGWSNNSNDSQFTDTFGPNWEEQVQVKATPAQLALLRKYQFSLFDAMFGFEVPAVNEVHDVPYITDHKRYGNSSLNDTFCFDAYLPSNLNFGDGKPDLLPVIIMNHGGGMERGWENAWEFSRLLASFGYLVCDPSYGIVGNASRDNDTYGYDFTDDVRQLGNFTWMLQQNASYYHADLGHVYFSGRSLGGYYASVCAYGYNKTYFAGMFANTLVVRGCLPFYPMSDINFTSQFLNLIGDWGMPGFPIINGSSDPHDANYNPQWNYYNPAWIVQDSASGTLCPTIIFQGSHDLYVPHGYTRSHRDRILASGNVAILCTYLLQNHGFDALYWSPCTQSILYYYERFLILTS